MPPHTVHNISMPDFTLDSTLSLLSLCKEPLMIRMHRPKACRDSYPLVLSHTSPAHQRMPLFTPSRQILELTPADHCPLRTHLSSIHAWNVSLPSSSCTTSPEQDTDCSWSKGWSRGLPQGIIQSGPGPSTSSPPPPMQDTRSHMPFNKLYSLCLKVVLLFISLSSSLHSKETLHEYGPP